jgi:hypothetical protein
LFQLVSAFVPDGAGQPGWPPNGLTALSFFPKVIGNDKTLRGKAARRTLVSLEGNRRQAANGRVMGG